AVAVVVDPVARLGDRLGRADALAAVAVDALLRALAARADVDAAGDRLAAGALAPFVGRAVAVLVDLGLVADLFARRHVARALAPGPELEAVGALHGSVGACAHAALRGGPPKARRRLAGQAGAALFDGVVAIVVHPVAAHLLRHAAAARVARRTPVE